MYPFIAFTGHGPAATVTARPAACAHCGTTLPDEADRCPVCGESVRGGTPPSPAVEEPTPRDAGGDGRPASVPPRMVRLRQWAEWSQPLGVTLPTLPGWAEEASRHGLDRGAWLEVVRGVERLAQQRVLVALETWERATRNRLTRLEAYSVDGRLERDQIDDVLHAARQGDIAPALQTYQQVDRVVALKERHLDQAREELERLVSLLRDMEALGFALPADPTEAAEELEAELRGGRLAPLKQRLRSIRLQTVTRIKTALPAYVAEYGAFLVRERSGGASVDLEAAELARAARAFVEGRPEESLRRLRLLQQVHGAGAVRASAAAPRAETGATGSVREA
ncbi:MAG TPA: zinc ribbon domain-containing protein [Thermoplasmata archaeon]|nr:zinc ribbon domain-containing protein [Thermoplasmata archaeon]